MPNIGMAREVSVGASHAPCLTLEQALLGCAMVVQRVQPPDFSPEWARWLEEIGFLPGERVMLMARALPGGDPLVVRVGQSTFALRRAEAACVQVLPVTQTEPAPVKPINTSACAEAEAAA